MNRELTYTNLVGLKHIKNYGQYFTQRTVAEFMCDWACCHADTMLDPAVGNSAFLLQAHKKYPACTLTGFEIDKTILEYFGTPPFSEINNSDYLLNDWNSKYDAIVCNPPYKRFQAIANRVEIMESIYKHTGVRYSGYTNLYILFLIKSIYQLSAAGRLAYIIPTEFLNSKYGIPIKEMLISQKLLTAIINFQNNHEMFFNATTTCCILLLDKAPKDSVVFYNLSSVKELSLLKVGESFSNSIFVKYKEINANEKWRSYINLEPSKQYANLKDISDFCSVSRGIATGANDFFCMSKSKAQKNGIPQFALKECICKSADVKTAIFKHEDFERLSAAEKTVYLLDIKKGEEGELKEYIQHGEAAGINKKYLLSCRNPWYSMEQKPIAPIWVSPACRNNIKFVRNLAGVKALTTFHSIFIKDEFKEDIDIIFCYFLTPVAQNIIRQNRKELGNGLDKFQPNDLKNAQMLDISVLSENDRALITSIYHDMLNHFEEEQIETLNDIFTSYLTV